MIGFAALIASVTAHGWMQRPYTRRGNEKDFSDGNRYNMDAFFTGWNKNPKSKERMNRCPSFAGTDFGDTPTKEFKIVEVHKPGSIIDVELKLPTKHTGPHWFEFACMDQHLDLGANDASIQWTKLILKNGQKAGQVESGHKECITSSAVSDGTICKLKVQMPSGECSHGVFQWNWKNTESKPGGGKLEHFKHCADVKLGTGTPADPSPPSNPGAADPSPSSNPGAADPSPSSNPGDPATSPSSNPGAPATSPPSSPTSLSPDSETSPQNMIYIALAVIGVVVAIIVFAYAFAGKKDFGSSQHALPAQHFKTGQKRHGYAKRGSSSTYTSHLTHQSRKNKTHS